MAADGITIVDVVRDMKIEPLPSLTWPVGARVRDLYEYMYGRAPQKKLRTKTSGAGSHCFATYPHHMWDAIASIVRMHHTETQRQMELPF